MSFSKQTYQSPAKLNLRLFVQSKRADGYHNLSLDFIPISLFDSLTFEPATAFTLITDLDFPAEDNLISKAHKLLEEEAKKPLPVKITLEKNIPSGAGLGGGSGNAACTLVVLNRIFNLKITDDRLKELALILGADVPFFIDPKPSIATGLGEKLTPITLPQELYFILFKPELSINTGEAYRHCLHSGRQLRPEDFTLENLKKITTKDNDFFLPLSEIYKELGDVEKTLLGTGADAVGFSGSGSTLFALFSSKGKRDSSYKNLSPSFDSHLYQVDSTKAYPFIVS
ncbi:MAG: 4-(cytidine 5'-diphospho)-2-C-methyl-D-erythritol kinase [SAR324 cluster bacterium]|nr:4-(cytidine 5'-diphospho)-2-C-methyl-D-erythritol kinase [SAR324 cluster bacterium]